MADYIGGLPSRAERRAALAQVPEGLRGRVQELVLWDFEERNHDEE